MKILFITSHAHLPQLYGGLQTSTDQLCRYLMKRGNQVCLLSGLTKNDKFGRSSRNRMHLNRLTRQHKVSRDTVLGYPVWRTWTPWSEAQYVVTREKPDVIVVKSGDTVRIASTLMPTGIPLILQLHDVEFHLHNGELGELRNITCIANSYFTAAKYHNTYAVNPYVIYPFISADQYRTASTRENVTFINPHPQKGVDIALNIARQCPDIPFSFVQSWTLNEIDKSRLYDQLAGLSNVTLHPPTSDMKQVYKKCRILLVPSRWEEAYGRVVSEAQFSGIPAIASNRGGLPESVGTGGILLNPDGPIDGWNKAIRKLWSNKEYYASLSAEAYNYSSRPALNQNNQAREFEDICTTAITGWKSYTAPMRSGKRFPVLYS